MQIIRAADCRRMPWKNGGGETIEMAVAPSGARIDAFDWRLSMARVETGGPFSVFAGIDRTLCLLAGDGILLTVAGSLPVRLEKSSAPFAFPGDVPSSASLIGGTVVDLNVMTKRNAFSHTVQRFEIRAATRLEVSGSPAFLLCAAGEASVSHAEGQYLLGEYDTLALAGDAKVLDLCSAETATLYLVEITRAA